MYQRLYPPILTPSWPQKLAALSYLSQLRQNSLACLPPGLLLVNHDLYFSLHTGVIYPQCTQLNSARQGRWRKPKSLSYRRCRLVKCLGACGHMMKWENLLSRLVCAYRTYPPPRTQSHTHTLTHTNKLVHTSHPTLFNFSDLLSLEKSSF